MKLVTILGSTGSIGKQALEVVEANSDSLGVFALSCDMNIEILFAQIKKFAPKIVAVRDSQKAIELRQLLENNLDNNLENNLYNDKKYRCEVVCGEDGINQVASIKVGLTVNALVGISGLLPTLKAICAGNDIALANKETLVVGGEIVVPLAKKYGVQILPIDSEHSAIWQCMDFNKEKNISKIILTASGGAFYDWDKTAIEHAGAVDALKHPTWTMGAKVTIDSATLLNKGFEIIEAMHLFNKKANDIQIVVHKQSVVHSMVQYEDGSITAQMSYPDMRLPISLALLYPKRDTHCYSPLSFDGLNLTFESPDYDKFPCLKIAMECAEKGGAYPIILNGASEILVQQFIMNNIKFYEINKFLQNTLDIVGKDVKICDYSQIVEYDILAKNTVRQLMYEELL